MAESGLRGAGTRVLAPEPHEAVGDDVVEPRHQYLDPGRPTYLGVYPKEYAGHHPKKEGHPRSSLR